MQCRVCMYACCQACMQGCTLMHPVIRSLATMPALTRRHIPRKGVHDMEYEARLHDPSTSMYACMYVWLRCSLVDQMV